MVRAKVPGNATRCCGGKVADGGIDTIINNKHATINAKWRKVSIPIFHLAFIIAC